MVLETSFRRSRLNSSALIVTADCFARSRLPQFVPRHEHLEAAARHRVVRAYCSIFMFFVLPISSTMACRDYPCALHRRWLSRDGLISHFGMISAPTSTMMVDNHIHTRKPMTAPSEP